MLESALESQLLEVNLPGLPLVSAARPGSSERRAGGTGGPQA